METKHTAGPWITQPSKDGSGDIGIRAPDVLGVIAECFADMRHAREFALTEAAANARLIAAAPDLLAALKAMVLNDTHTYRDCHKAALTAIAKAEERTIP